MFWKKFKQARSANELFNQASEQWRQRQRFMVEGDEQSEREACTEVVRLCQLSIKTDERMGDAYVLLANALTVAASHGAGRSDKERYEFLQSRAAAVMHFWYTLPHREYPITKNAAIGERLWRIMIDDISKDKSLSKDAAVALMESYRGSLASEAISPDSFEGIREMVLRTASALKPDRWESREPLEETLPTEIWEFLVKIARKRVQDESGKDQIIMGRFSRIEAELDKLERIVDSRRVDAWTEVQERFKQAYDGKDFRQALGWLTWLFILGEHEERITPASMQESLAKLWKAPVAMLMAAIGEARQTKEWDALLLAVGFCEWVGLSTQRDEILRVVYDGIGELAAYSRLLDIEQQPRMMGEGLLVSRLRRRLEKS